MRTTILPRVCLVGSVLCGSGTAFATSPDVSPSGLPSYTVTVAVPPGVGSAEPAVTLTYDGKSVLSPVGHGWALGPAEAVTRCSMDVRLDGMRRGATGEVADKLCLAGQRLVPTSSTGGSPVVGASSDAQGLAGTSFREYRTADDSYARIRAYGIADGTNVARGPAYFRVWTKTGDILDYGSSPDALTDANALALPSATPNVASPSAHRWLLARRVDRFGNAIHYKYDKTSASIGTTVGTQSGDEWTLAEIAYSGNKIVFSYGVRPAATPSDARESYEFGVKLVYTKRLTGITTYVNSANPTARGPAANAVPVRSYKLEYDQGPTSRRSRLRSITECAGGSLSTNCDTPHRFEYSNGGTNAYTTVPAFNLGSVKMLHWGVTSQTLPETTSVEVFDANGDGRADLLRWGLAPSSNALFLSNGDGSFTQSYSFNLTNVVLQDSISPSDPTVADGARCTSMLLRDFNGDGLVDIFKHVAPAGSKGRKNVGVAAAGNCPGGESVLYLSNGDGSFAAKPITGVDLPIGTRPYTERQGVFTWPGGDSFTFFDYDGDGRLDVMTHRTELYEVPIGAGGGGIGCPSGVICTRLFKGDGQGGFAEVSTNVAYVNTYTGADGGDIGGRTEDLDGDGLNDIFSVDNWSTSPQKRAQATFVYSDVKLNLLSRGDGNFTILANSPCNQAGSSTADLNGDGLADCPLANNYSIGIGLPVRTALDFRSLTSGIPFNEWPYDARLGIADMNSDGRADTFNLGVEGSPASAQAVRLSNGDGTFSTDTNWNQAGVLFRDYYVRFHDYRLGDFLGNGTTQILRMKDEVATSQATTPIENLLFARTSSDQPDLLTRVTTPQGLNYDFEYVNVASPQKSLNDPLGARYLTDLGTANAPEFPHSGITTPGPIVATVTSDTGAGTQRLKTEFQYRGLVRDKLTGRQLGFRETRRQQPAADGGVLTTVEEVTYDYGYEGRTRSSTVYNAALNAVGASTILKRKVNVWCDQYAGSSAGDTAITARKDCMSPGPLRRQYLLWAQATSKDLSGAVGPTETVEQRINDSGEPTLTRTTVIPAGGGTAYVTETSNAYLPNETSCSNPTACSWNVALRSTSTVRRTAPAVALSTSAGAAAGATAIAGTATLNAPRTPPTSATLAATQVLLLLLSDE